MSKKNKKQQEVKSEPAAVKQKTIFASGFKSMTNWLVVLVAVLPFLYSPTLIEPVIPPRYLFLGIFILVFSVLFFFVYKKTGGVKFPFLILLVFLLGLAFNIWSIAGSAQAVNPNEGFYHIGRQLLYLALLFIVLFTVINEENQLLKIAKTITITGIIHSIIGLAQTFGSGFMDLPGNFYPYGLMANRNLYGSAQTLLIPFVLMVIHQGNKIWKYTGLVSLLLIILSVFVSQTRSAWVATVLIFVVSLILIAWFSKTSFRKWATGVFAGAVVSFLLMALIFYGNTNEDFASSIQRRTASFTQSIADTTAEQQNITERIKKWNKTIGLIKKAPVMGVGSGNWRIRIMEMGTEGMYWDDGYIVPDQTHNDYLHIASESGLPGALFFFGSWLLITLMGFYVVRKSQSESVKMTAIFMLAGLAAYASDSMLSFPDSRMEHKMYFTLLCGIIGGLYYHVRKNEEQKAKPLASFIPLMIILIAAFNVYVGIVRYNFEKHMYRARDFDKQQQYNEVLKEVKAAKNKIITLDAIAKPVEIYSSIAYKETKEYKKALQEAELAEKYNPNRSMNYNNIGTVFMDMRDYTRAEHYLQKALKMTPKFQVALKNMAGTYFQLKKYKECVETIEKIKDWQTDEYLASIYNYSKRQIELNPAATPAQ